ncbi:uncharacterized protein LOC121878588 [Homarus americanus]|uniref:uncharacterized protein LOC121878588 n=1 Tax=Homarus americanus TaxID=6706 RepID=UPI001C4790F7|nr:uncharacterized protein LOC121878588 [Homarus americanus]
MGDVVASPNALNNRKTTAPRDHTGLTLLRNHPRATGNLLGVAGATWDPPRGSRGPRDPPRGSQGPWSYPDKVVPPGTLQRPYRAGALREPPRCGREHPSSGWGHWDPPRGSRGPMDPIPEAAGDLVLTQGRQSPCNPPRSGEGTKDTPRGGGGPQYLSRCDRAPRDPPRVGGTR